MLELFTKLGTRIDRGFVCVKELEVSNVIVFAAKPEMVESKIILDE